VTDKSPARPTIHDVAARAGVSKSLVSLAMRGSPKVREASRTAILAAAAELGYRPNATARSLADRRSRTVGVLILDLHNPVFAQILDGVQSRVRERGYSTMLVTGGTDPTLERAELDKLLEFQVEGLILISHRLTAADLRSVAREVPTVVVTRRDITGPRIDTVSNDDVAGAAMAVEHLVALGHRRITHVSGGDNPVSHDRCRGYLEAMSAAGLSSRSRVVDGALTDAGGYAAADEALGAPRPPTALFVANDLAALGAVAAVQGRGLAVPEDVSVVGYDGMALGALPTLSLTTVAQPLAEMGAIAAGRLVARIDRPGSRARHTSVEARLVVRGSTGRVPNRTRQGGRTPARPSPMMLG
jgi:DNA-binding LacI/PurR family transcriptional regulator